MVGKKKTNLQGGKEVLIKSIVKAIPTYAMSCFIIPVNIIEEIEGACARFWWHQKKWRELCSTKAFGGMGFKDLTMFNQALLG